MYGNYPPEFHAYHLKLAPAGLIMRPPLLLRARLPTFTITEDLLSAHERPFESEQEARQLGSRGDYRPGGAMQLYGFTVVRCHTSMGILEFSVQKCDEAVLLAYIDIAKHRQAAAHGSGGGRRQTAWVQATGDGGAWHADNSPEPIQAVPPSLVL